MKSFIKTNSSWLVIAALLCAGNVWAQDPDLATNYMLVKSFDFGGDIDVARSSDKISYTAYNTSSKKQDAIYSATAPEGIVGWIGFQATRANDGGDSKGWWNRSGWGLWSKATRSAVIYGDDLTLGSIVAFTCRERSASEIITLTNGDGNADGTFTYQLSEDGKTYYCTITAEENAHIGFCAIYDKGYIENISIYQLKVSTATYQVKYQDTEGNELKEPTTESGIPGSLASITETHKKNIKANDAVYIYVSDDAAEIAADGTTIVTLTFRKAETWDYTVNAVDGEGNVLKTLTQSSNFETESTTTYYSRYVLSQGMLYEREAVNYEYKYTFTLSADKMNVNLLYEKTSTTDAYYYSEAEDIEGLTIHEDGYTNIRMSNGAAAYATELSTITSLPAGVYTLKSASRAGSTTFYAGSREVLTMSTDGGVVNPTSEEFTLYEPTEIKVSAGSNKNYFDYVLICRVGEAPDGKLSLSEGDDFAPEYDAYTSATYTRTIEAGKYGTICLPFAPDAASLENYTFFTMESAADGVINFVEEEAPVANTPYIYCLNAGKEATAITGGATVVSATTTDVVAGDWTMKGSFTNQSIDATAGNYYGLSSGTIVKANKTLTVKPYRAYFTSATGESAVALRITRGDETTGITTADLDVQPATVIYDLAGRRVEKMEKGIYIVNGKKVIR